jgi:hypothetical protein
MNTRKHIHSSLRFSRKFSPREHNRDGPTLITIVNITASMVKDINTSILKYNDFYSKAIKSSEKFYTYYQENKYVEASKEINNYYIFYKESVNFMFKAGYLAEDLLKKLKKVLSVYEDKSYKIVKDKLLGLKIGFKTLDFYALSYINESNPSYSTQIETIVKLKYILDDVLYEVSKSTYDARNSIIKVLKDIRPEIKDCIKKSQNFKKISNNVKKSIYENSVKDNLLNTYDLVSYPIESYDSNVKEILICVNKCIDFYETVKKESNRLIDEANNVTFSDSFIKKTKLKTYKGTKIG